MKETINATKVVKCPFCDSTNTTIYSAFGTTLALVQYVCDDCNSPFEWIKWEEEKKDTQK